ncbi:peptidyl-prolyl cis-trans isomerase FKBP19, chloroplastic isoform X2 [Chenopodium quinoa]|uniref:peptidyl-prolyl cis-trans isomerase FKBP19, chloroplastic isoform X2 n=1 Tax=Chenopodium quinoa TaxID=63459 RepID=UPI000B77BAC3|nr:peptidyl-prolyl cis-trans isomerase FKBP19, chloroplastic isoform X2 [Chenopodium quinoa]
MGTQQLQLPLASSSSSTCSTILSSILSHHYNCRSTTTSLLFNRSTTTNTILSLSLNHVNHRRSIQHGRVGMDDSGIPATTTAFEDEEDDVLELLRKNKDMLFGEKLLWRFDCAPFYDSLNLTCKREGDNDCRRVDLINRRQVLLSSVGSIAGFLNAASFLSAPPSIAASSGSGFADMPALRGKDYGKTKMRYPDYIETESGLQFKDLRKGTGPTPKIGESVVVDWDGYTIGYYGRIFEARNKTKGGSFEGDDKEFFKFKIGSQEVIPAFEEAVLGMSLGGIRRVIVPPELGYPDNDYTKKGPKPTTFSGQRALDFVLRNQGLIDKTLLFDIELLKIVSN